METTVVIPILEASRPARVLFPVPLVPASRITTHDLCSRMLHCKPSVVVERKLQNSSFIVETICMKGSPACDPYIQTGWCILGQACSRLHDAVFQVLLLEHDCTSTARRPIVMRLCLVFIVTRELSENGFSGLSKHTLASRSHQCRLEPGQMDCSSHASLIDEAAAGRSGCINSN